MKNKSKTYVLLALVLGIWGIIAYKILATINPPEQRTTTEDLYASFSPKAVAQTDTFSIKMADRDPFLGTLRVKHKINDQPKKHNKGVVWLPIIYHGSVIKQESKKEVFIISINGQQYIMKAGQIMNEVKLVKGSAKTITVNYKGAIKTISRHEHS